MPPKGKKSLPRPHVRVREPQRLAFLIGDDLLEGLAKIEIEIVPFGPTEMRNAERVRHFQQGVITPEDRFLFINVNGGVTWPAGLQGRYQGARRDEFRTGRVDDEGGRLHAGEV